jgi:anti-sigma factor RsiW
MICERVEKMLDAYVSNELLVETCAEVNHHLAGCLDCSAAIETRCQLKGALQRALARESVPAHLITHVRGQIRQARRF